MNQFIIILKNVLTASSVYEMNCQRKQMYIRRCQCPWVEVLLNSPNLKRWMQFLLDDCRNLATEQQNLHYKSDMRDKFSHLTNVRLEAGSEKSLAAQFHGHFALHRPAKTQVHTTCCFKVLHNVSQSVGLVSL